MSELLTLVVPCYNEESRLDLGAFRRLLESESATTVVFVDDGSTDGTAALLETFSAEWDSRVILHSMPRNVGKAEAVRQGLLRALASDAALVGFWDADLATPLDAIPDFLGVLRRHQEIDWVIGARVQLLGRDIRRRSTRHYAGRVFATAASLVLDLPVYDTQCGAKLFRASPALRQVLERRFLSRWIFDVEMIARYLRVRRTDGASSHGLGIYELPLNRWVDVAGSKVRARDFVTASLELLRIWRELHRIDRSR